MTPASRRNRAALLLAAEILLIGTSALWEDSLKEAIWINVIYASFFCAGGYVLANSKRWLISYIAIALGAITAGALSPGKPAEIVHLLFVAGAHVMLFYAIISHSFLKPKVKQSDRLLAGIAGYLLLGLFWTLSYRLLTVISAAPLTNLLSETPITRADEIYFSFSTLTTLGYGDIVPATPAAKVAAIFTTLSGVLYLAIFVSALVGGLKGTDRK